MPTKLFESTKKPLVVESKKVLRGPFARMDEFNQNRRRYPRGVYKPACEALLPKIQDRRLLGELDHPLQYDEVRLANVSHVITDIQIHESGEVTGRVELLDTPAGLVAQALVEAGVPLGISSRGLGATKKVNEGLEVTSLKLITFDLVAEPSFGDAILLNESAYTHLQESLTRIEETLPLNESVESQSVREMINKYRETIKLEEKKTDDIPDAELALFENEILQEVELQSLKESVEIQADRLGAMESLLCAKEEEIRAQGRVIKDQARIIESLKSRILKAGADPEELAALVESVGQLTLSNVEAETRLLALESNMENLQEQYNLTVEELKKAKASSESLNEEVVTLRKKLALESRGLSWKKYSHLLEGLTTEREIEDKLNSVRNLSNTSTVSPEKVVRTLTESESLTGNSNRLSNIIARV